MNSSAHEAYQRKLQEIASEYRAQGYDVRIEPGPKDVPAFLTGFRPDLIARGPHDSVVVEVKVGTTTAASERFRELAQMIRQQPGWRFSLVVIDPRSDEVAPSVQPLLNRQAIADRLERANELRRAGIKDAAFLLFWVSIEALLRQLATREGLPLERIPSSALLKELFSLGILSREDLEVAQRAFAVRSALVHGFEATGLDQTTDAVARLAQQLLAELDQHVE
jgi:REase_AHJR-like